MKKYKVTKSFRFGGKLYHVYADTEREAYELNDPPKMVHRST